MRTARLFALVALASLVAAPVRAQVLDGTWFKIKVVTKGWEISTIDGSAKQASHNQTVYMSLIPKGIGYSAQIYSELTPDNWVGGPAIDFGTAGVDEFFAVNQGITIAGPDGVSLDFSATLRFTFKFNDEDVLIKSTLKTLAGELAGSSTLDGGENLYIGSVKLTGKLVDAANLPF